MLSLQHTVDAWKQADGVARGSLPQVVAFPRPGRLSFRLAGSSLGANLPFLATYAELFRRGGFDGQLGGIRVARVF